MFGHSSIPREQAARDKMKLKNKYNKYPHKDTRGHCLIYKDDFSTTVNKHELNKLTNHSTYNQR